MVDRKTTSVDRLYSEGRSYPRGQTRDPGARERIPVEPAFETGNMRNGVFNRNTVRPRRYPRTQLNWGSAANSRWAWRKDASSSVRPCVRHKAIRASGSAGKVGAGAAR
jgi:hypothetical protein